MRLEDGKILNLRVAPSIVPNAIAVAATITTCSPSVTSPASIISATTRCTNSGHIVYLCILYENQTESMIKFAYSKAVRTSAYLGSVCSTRHIAIGRSSRGAAILEFISAIAFVGVLRARESKPGSLACLSATLNGHASSWGYTV